MRFLTQLTISSLLVCCVCLQKTMVCARYVLRAAAAVLRRLAVDEKLDGWETADFKLCGKVLLLGGVHLWKKHD